MGILGGANSTKHNYLLNELGTILLPNFVWSHCNMLQPISSLIQLVCFYCSKLSILKLTSDCRISTIVVNICPLKSFSNVLFCTVRMCWTPMFPTRLLFSENIVATLYPGPAAAAAPQRAASFWPQKPQLFVGSFHCGTWFCAFSEEWGMTERSGRDPGAGIRSARTGDFLAAGNSELALWG